MSKPLDENRCEHTDRGGRRCRMIRSATHPNLCHWHAVSEERKLLEARERAARTSPEYNVSPTLLTGVSDLRSGAAINHVLSRLVLLLGENSISTRRAAVIAYSCNLLLHSLKELRYEKWYAKTYPHENLSAVALLDVLPPLKPNPSPNHDAVQFKHFTEPKPAEDKA
jgi:hypothetical protein